MRFCGISIELSISLKRIHRLIGSLWKSGLTNKEPISCLKQDKTSRTSVSRISNPLIKFRDISDLVTLKFCGEELIEANLLEKTFSTFPASCLVLQQQYSEIDELYGEGGQSLFQYIVVARLNKRQGMWRKSSPASQLP